MVWWEILLCSAGLVFFVLGFPFVLAYGHKYASVHAFLDAPVITYDDTEPRRLVQYKFDGVLHQHEVKIVTQVDDGAIAFEDIEGRSYLVHTDEWREINVPVGLKDHADE